jgi:hypothetical protein
MDKLQRFAYKPTTPVGPPSTQQSPTVLEEVEHPATPMPQRIPLSDLISNTPIRQETSQNISPEEKVVWKLSPKKILEIPRSSQVAPRPNTTTFLNLLNDDNDSGKKVNCWWMLY